MKKILACVLFCACAGALAARDPDFVVLDNQKVLLLMRKDSAGNNAASYGESQLSEFYGD
ncbi:MAG: hypothetical protein HY801_12500 [Candidatus Lindowbacteria bacterium]|nr:hypothetical protein [Candidatus Lindowbacteria bacterium]